MNRTIDQLTIIFRIAHSIPKSTRTSGRSTWAPENGHFRRKQRTSNLRRKSVKNERRSMAVFANEQKRAYVDLYGIISKVILWLFGQNVLVFSLFHGS